MPRAKTQYATDYRVKKIDENKLSADHALPSKLERYKRAERSGDRAEAALFNRVDAVIDDVYEDLCNGMSRTDIIKKLSNGDYKDQKRGLSPRTSSEYFNVALDRMHFNTDIRHEQLKDLFYHRFENILKRALKKDDLTNARQILDSMARIFLGEDAAKNKIEINSNDGKVVIKFGFNDDNNDDIEDAEIIDNE